MEDIYREFFSAMHQFQKLRIGDMFPELTKGDCMVLMAIGCHNKRMEDGVLTVSELAERMELQSSAVSRTLKTLEDKGYIERTIKRSDRRNTYVELTENGRVELKKVEEILADFSKSVIGRIDQESMNKLIEYLNELYRVSKEEIDIRRKNKRGESVSV